MSCSSACLGPVGLFSYACKCELRWSSMSKNWFKRMYQSRCSSPTVFPCLSRAPISYVGFRCASVCFRARSTCDCTRDCWSGCCGSCYSCFRAKSLGISCSLLAGADSKNTLTACYCILEIRGLLG